MSSSALKGGPTNACGPNVDNGPIIQVQYKQHMQHPYYSGSLREYLSQRELKRETVKLFYFPKDD
jgi:hypothetical protein